jgi:hypothetical protein
MGFSWRITFNTDIDEKTGLPVVEWLNPNLGHRVFIPYKPEDYSVPEKYREFLNTRNEILCSYTKDAYENMNVFQLPVEDLLYYFPKWSAVTARWDEAELGDWTEEKHTLFWEALSWMASKHCFMASWTY